MLTVEAKVIGVVMISSPASIPRASRVRCSPAVAELSGTAKGAPDVGPKSLLEALDLGAGGDPAGFEGVDDLVDLGLVDGGG